MKSVPTNHHSLFSSLLIAVSAFLLVCSPAFPAEQPGGSPVKIFILAGQSNMQGHGNISPVTIKGTLEYIVANDPRGDYQFLVNGSGGWAEWDDVWIHYERSPAPTKVLRYGNLTAGYGVSDTSIGPELGFGYNTGKHCENQVLIVKASWGGKSLAVDFRPPSSGGSTGFYYNEILRLVNDVVTNLKTYFPDYNEEGYEIAGFGWHQGWNDRVNQAYNDEYEVNMANFIRDMREDLDVPGLPFVIATTGMSGWAETHPRALSLMEAQLAVAQYPEFVGNVFTVETRDFWRDVADSPANLGYHWNKNAETYLNIGLAMGEEMVKLLPGECPYNLRASRGPDGVTLTWRNGDPPPTSVRILRNSVEIAAAAPVDPPTFTDTDSPDHGLVTYTLISSTESCDPLTIEINLNVPAPGGAVIYEPFDYTAGGLDGQYGGSELSLDKPWSAHSTALVTAGTLTYGALLPTTGGQLSDFTSDQNRYGGHRPVRTAVLADNNLLADGAELWFSLLAGTQAGANLVNIRLGFALASDPFSTVDDDWNLSAGEGVGLDLARGKPYAAFYSFAQGERIGISTGSSYPVSGGHGLLVGKITWGATPTDPDTVQLYQPDTSLNMGSVISSVQMIVDQSAFDTLTFRRGDTPLLDEIRFGATYDAVTGIEGFPPFTTTLRPALTGLDLSWESRNGMRYNVWSSPDMMADRSGWTLVEGNIDATPPGNTRSVSSSETHLFFLVEEFPAN